MSVGYKELVADAEERIEIISGKSLSFVFNRFVNQRESEL